MELQYRKLQSSDLETYKNLRLKAFQESSTSFSESYEDEFTLPFSHFEGCIGFEEKHFTMGCFSDKNNLVGIATFRRDKRSKALHKSYIYTMYVDTEYRGQGIGKTILEKIIALAKPMPGLEQIHLWVLNPKVSSARSMYLKAGWKAQGTIVEKDLVIDGKYVDAEYMVLSF